MNLNLISKSSLKHVKVEKLLIFALFILAINCTFSTKTRKDPVFIVDSNVISERISKIVQTQEVNLSGTEIKSKKKNVSELTVRLINPLNVPSDSNGRAEVGKQIAKLIRDALKAPEEYDLYHVFFVYEKNEGAVSTSNYVGVSYKREELSK